MEIRIKKRNDTNYYQKWVNINNKSKEILSDVNTIESMSEGKVFYQLAELLPEDSTIFVGNSMPIRDLDSFFFYNQKKIRVMANRGANGIDGTISTALGAATKHQPMYLLLGDLTFFHDLNGLVAAKLQQLNITIIVINNNGGGIFSFLPQATQPKHFELLFGTPLDLDFSKVVEMYGGQFVRINDWNQFTSAMLEDRQHQGLRVLEIVTNRDSNVKEHHDLWNRVSQEIDRFLQGKNV